MNEYEIIKTFNQEYIALVTMCNSYAPLQYLEVIESDLIKQNIFGSVLLDQILHVGNTDERFILIEINENGINRSSIKFIRVSKKSFFRKLTCDLLVKENLLDTSILSSIQKKMIIKGLVI